MNPPAPFREIQLKGARPRKEWFDSVYQERNKVNIFNIFLNTDIKQTSLPLNFLKDICINHAPNFEIQDRVILQINEVIDISQPEELRKKMEVSARKTLKLLLTDGENIVIGLSKSPINNQINPAADPGSKVLLKPPVMVKYGVIFLNNDNIQYYGGKSPELIKKRNDIYKKVSFVRKISSNSILNNSDSQKNKEIIEEVQTNNSQKKTSKFNLSSSTSSSPSSSPSSSCPNVNIQNNNQKNRSQSVTKKAASKPSNTNKLQFLSSDDSYLESDDSYLESSLSK